MLFSAPEFQFTRDGVCQNLRSDGRENHESRPVEISLGNHESKLSESFNKKKRNNMMIITRAVGQAKVRMGKGSCGRTEVVCAITGQVCSFDEDEDEEEDDALLLFMGQRRSGGGGGRDKTGGNEKAGTSTAATMPSVEVYVETMSTRNVGSAVGGGGKGQHQQQVFNETDKYCGELKRELEFAYGSMDLLNKESGLRKSLEIGGSSHGNGSKQGGRRRHRWKLRMDFLVLSDDGNALDALAIAGKCALFDARLPRVRVKRRGEDEEVELVSDSEEEEDDDDDDEQLEKGKEKESNSSRSSNTTLDVSDVPLIATATYFGRARQKEGVTTMTTITIDDEEFLPTIAIDCVSSEESCGDFALAVSATREGAVTSVQRVGGFGNSSAMAVESDVSDNVIKFARKHCVKIHGEIDSYLSTLALREDEDEEDEDSLASSESEDEEMEEANQDEF